MFTDLLTRRVSTTVNTPSIKGVQVEISTLGEFIRWKRTMGGMSQGELSAIAKEKLPRVRGLHRSAVAHWEQDTRIPNHAQARAVGDALQLNPTEQGQLSELIIEAELKKN